MAESEGVKSVEAEYESDADGVSALRWTARRMEASDDDDDDEDSSEELKEKYRWSCAGRPPRDESDGGEGASECYDELEGGRFLGEELEEVSQEEEEEELQETVHRVNKAKEKKKKKAVRDEVLVPRSAWFYMHDDRFLRRRHRTRRDTMIGMKLWDCTDEPKWKHDKFEDMAVQDKSAPRSSCQQQRKNRTKGHRYEDTNQFGSFDNYGNPNNKTSRIVKGRGLAKYKPIVRSNNLNPSSKRQIPAKPKESTSCCSSSRVSSRASSHDIFMTWRSKEQFGRSNKWKTTSTQQDNKQLVALQTYQPYSIQENQDNKNRIPLPRLYPVIEQTPITSTIRASLPRCSQQLTLHPGNEYNQTSSECLAANSYVETLPQTTYLGHDFVRRGVLRGAVRGSFELGGSSLLSPVIHHGGLPYGAVDDHAPTMALVGYAPQAQLGSRNWGKTSMIAGAAKPCNINRPPASR